MYGRKELRQLQKQLRERRGFVVLLDQCLGDQPDTSVTPAQLENLRLWQLVARLKGTTELCDYPPVRETVSDVANRLGHSQAARLTTAEYAFLVHAHQRVYAPELRPLVTGNVLLATTDPPGNVRYLTLHVELWSGTGQVIRDPMSALMDFAGTKFVKAISDGFRLVAWMNGQYAMSHLDVVWSVSQDGSSFDEVYDGPSGGACFAVLLDSLVRRATSRWRWLLRFPTCHKTLYLGQVNTDEMRLEGTGDIASKLETTKLRSHRIRTVVVFSEDDQRKAEATVALSKNKVRLIRRGPRDRPIPHRRSWGMALVASLMVIAAGAVWEASASNAPEVRFASTEYQLSPGGFVDLVPMLEQPRGIGDIRWRLMEPLPCQPRPPTLDLLGTTAARVRLPAECDLARPLVVEFSYASEGQQRCSSLAIVPQSAQGPSLHRRAPGKPQSNQ